MSLEKTVMSDDDIFNIVRSHWNIECQSHVKMKLGTANCFRICSENGTFFLKEFQSDISEEAILREAEVLEKLQGKGIPTSSFLRTISGSKFVFYKGHYLILEKFIDGQNYGYYDYPKEMLPELAEMLAKIHVALKDVLLPVSLDSSWVNEDAVPKYEKLLSVLEEHREDLKYPEIREDLLYKYELLRERQHRFRQYFDGITYGASHGDYQGCQIIGENNRIKAVIDFSSARTLPIVWEIMRSYIQTSETTRISGQIDIQELCSYVKCYCKYAALSERDLEAMPFVYVFQLLRSTYGYKEYLQTQSEDREGLISFAFWRTKICKEVLEKAEKIVKALKEI